MKVWVRWSLVAVLLVAVSAVAFFWFGGLAPPGTPFGSQEVLTPERPMPTGLRGSFGSVGFRVVPPDVPSVEAGGDLTAPTQGCLLAAESPEQRNVGLMGVTDLGAYDGMVFRFDEDTTAGFYMRDTVIPLSIAWFDGDGRFVSSASMEPCLESTSCSTYYPTGAYRMALEVTQGWLPALGVRPGSKLVLTPSCR